MAESSALIQQMRKNPRNNPYQSPILDRFILDGQHAKLVQISEHDISSFTPALENLSMELIETDLSGSVYLKHIEIEKGIRYQLRRIPFLRKLFNPKQRSEQEIKQYLSDHKVNYLKELIREGKLFGIIVDGQVVSLQGSEQITTMPEPDSRPVIEFTKACTLPNFRGKDLTKRLGIAIIQEQQAQNPNVVWISLSRNQEVVISFLTRMGWKAVDIDSEDSMAKLYCETHKFDDNSIRIFKKDGYQVIYFDPY